MDVCRGGVRPVPRAVGACGGWLRSVADLPPRSRMALLTLREPFIRHGVGMMQACISDRANVREIGGYASNTVVKLRPESHNRVRPALTRRADKVVTQQLSHLGRVGAATPARLSFPRPKARHRGFQRLQPLSAPPENSAPSDAAPARCLWPLYDRAALRRPVSC